MELCRMLKRTKPLKKKNWVEEDLSKCPIKKRKKKEKRIKDTKETVKMSRLCKAGLFFLTVNHCGPLPLRELHSTDETLAWRDPGGS